MIFRGEFERRKLRVLTNCWAAFWSAVMPPRMLPFLFGRTHATQPGWRTERNAGIVGGVMCQATDHDYVYANGSRGFRIGLNAKFFFSLRG